MDSACKKWELLSNRTARNSLLEWESIRPRMIPATFNSKLVKMTIMQCYATNTKAHNEKAEQLYTNIARHAKVSINH